MENKEQQVSQEEMNKLLSQALIKANEENKQLKEEFEKAQPEIIKKYLKEQLKYEEAKIKELRHHLIDYYEDNYAYTDLQNCLMHVNYLKDMLRKL